jgi:hypothetical protein
MLFPRFREYKALRYALQRPWWRRMWVTQEVVLSERNAVLVYKGKRMGFAAFANDGVLRYEHLGH